jgi:ubiquinone biosynthesis UbiH/UbiF/VisC/COQ6 family hydroxylase
MAGKKRETTIVVAGAGPVGLLFALRLARANASDALRVRIVDAGSPARWQADAVDPRVYALSRESQMSLGDLWAVVAARRVSPYRRVQVFEGDDPRGQGSIVFDAAEIGEPDLGHIVEDILLRTVLLEALNRSGVETAFGGGVESIRFEAGRPTLVTSTGDALDADLVVGADGGDSRVRAAAGIEVFGKDYGQRALVSHVVTELPHRETAWQRFLPGGPLAFLPLADGRSSIVWTCQDRDAEHLLALGDQEFLEALQLASANVLGRIQSCSRRLSFPLALKHATTYTRPGVVLIGDAAHTVHPLAGQGMNLGLRDAVVLADTLTSAMTAGHNPGDEFVLRRYARAQTARNLGMQLAFDGLNTLFGPGVPDFAAPLRRLGMAAVDRAEPAKRMLMRRALGLERT